MTCFFIQSETMKFLLLLVVVAVVVAETKFTLNPPLGAKLVATSALNIRATACTSGRLIKTLPTGSVVTYNGKSVNACNYIWWEIKGDFGVAWAASNWLRQQQGGSNQRMNARGLALVKSFEGLRVCKYKDPVGIWTICYGHVIKDPQNWNCVTEARCEEILKSDLGRFETCVNSNVKVPINSNQFSALVSFSFNVGCGALQGSTLLRLLNQRQYNNVCTELKKWIYAGGRILPGLVRRRNAECDLFNS
jgi:lysozyme